MRRTLGVEQPAGEDVQRAVPETQFAQAGTDPPRTASSAVVDAAARRVDRGRPVELVAGPARYWFLRRYWRRLPAATLVAVSRELRAGAVRERALGARSADRRPAGRTKAAPGREGTARHTRAAGMSRLSDRCGTLVAARYAAGAGTRRGGRPGQAAHHADRFRLMHVVMP